MSDFHDNDDCEAQLAEVEMIEAAYGDSFHLLPDTTHSLTHSGDIAFDIVLPDHELSSLSLSIRLHVPCNYPQKPIRFILNSAKNLNKTEKDEIRLTIQSSIDCADVDSALGSLEICQMAIDLVREVLETQEAKKMENLVVSTCTPSKKRLARFLIYFHHIMSGKKRVAIVEQARDLDLGGYSKHGFPGIVIVEGFDYNVLEYVRRIQHLRWQQMVVRGEEFDEYVEDSEQLLCTGGSGGFRRKFPTPFTEIEGDSMSDIANLCKEYGCHDLFMTSMKKY
jgi:hypothetical protein